MAQVPLENAIDRLISKQMATQHIPGLALAVTQGDKVLYAKGYGIASSSQPVTAQTQFFTASVSKSFTAAAVMQLVEAGAINLDAPVQNYLPEFTLADPNTAARITSAMPLIAIALPQLKTGLIQLLITGESVSGGISLNWWGITMGILTLIGVGLAIRCLLRLRHWKQARHGIPLWRSLLSLSWMFFPAVLFLALPWLLALQSDRVFSYAMLYRAMPDVMIWLVSCALLGAINGTLRLSTLIQYARE